LESLDFGQLNCKDFADFRRISGCKADHFKMPKVNKKKRNSATSDAAAKASAAHSIFKMNTDIGQHVLKNPGIAEQ
jgi:hypothetical protein